MPAAMSVGRKRRSCPPGDVRAHNDGLAAVVSDEALPAAVKAKICGPVYADYVQIIS